MTAIGKFDRLNSFEKRVVTKLKNPKMYDGQKQARLYKQKIENCKRGDTSDTYLPELLGKAQQNLHFLSSGKSSKIVSEFNFANDERFRTITINSQLLKQASLLTRISEESLNIILEAPEDLSAQAIKELEKILKNEQISNKIIALSMQIKDPKKAFTACSPQAKTKFEVIRDIAFRNNKLFLLSLEGDDDFSEENLPSENFLEEINTKLKPHMIILPSHQIHIDSLHPEHNRNHSTKIAINLIIQEGNYEKAFDFLLNKIVTNVGTPEAINYEKLLKSLKQASQEAISKYKTTFNKASNDGKTLVAVEDLLIPPFGFEKTLSKQHNYELTTNLGSDGIFVGANNAAQAHSLNGIKWFRSNIEKANLGYIKALLNSDPKA